MSAPLEIITGIYDRCRWQSHDTPFGYHFLQDGTVIGGEADDGELLPNIPYQFWGKWKADTGHGKTFMFKQFLQKSPVSREGIIAYLEKYGELGYGTCQRIVDYYGQEAIGTVRTQPQTVAERLEMDHGRNRYRNVEKMKAAAERLRQRAGTESARLALTDLLIGRGFQTKLIDLAIEKWGLLAAARIRRDPFCLLVAGLPSAGFARCNKLYEDLGLPLNRLKRQMICMWYLIANETSGHTWYPAAEIAGMLGEKISGCEIDAKKAMRLGLRSQWLAKRRDGEGVLWLSTKERADDELTFATAVRSLIENNFQIDNLDVAKIITS